MDYELKEYLFNIWESESRQMAVLKYQDWKTRVPSNLEHAFEPLLKALTGWEKEVFAYFDHPITNAYTESLNSLIRVINRLVRGYSFEALRAKILYTEGLAKVRTSKYQKRKFTASYEFTEHDYQMLHQLSLPSLACEEPSEQLLGIDISTLIEKVEKGE
ncbi:transposase [Sulfoacidibacillus ferrooxidans]|nr:transposase [Sulfoacidibacillus ferrooxidans]